MHQWCWCSPTQHTTADALKFSGGIKQFLFYSLVVPSAPATNPAGTVTSSTSIFLEWDPPDVSDQNGVIIGYVVNVTVIATGEMFQLTTTSTNLPLDSLQPFTTYVCRIAARTVVGIGPYSIAVVATTEQAGELLPIGYL